ncbi:hypothetical protein [Streptomyces nogalater]|uniref:Uncharacterized protein n=1 Tax=Streptomyces nogalater TaxID=38314 RepID=A0ABW0WWB1_STRNO
MDVYEAGLATVLGLWLALTTVAQLGAAVPGVREALSAGPLRLVLPAYNFFAPVPGTSDAHLLVRLRSAEEVPGLWRELTGEPVRRRWDWVWNPGHREHKQMADLADYLPRTDPWCEASSTVLSVPYLLLLNRAVAAVAGSGPAAGTQVQFLTRPALSNDTSLASRPLLRLHGRRRAAFEDAVFAYPAVLVLFGLRMAAAVAVLVWPHRGPFHTIALGAVAAASVLWMMRGPAGREGADHLL